MFHFKSRAGYLLKICPKNQLQFICVFLFKNVILNKFFTFRNTYMLNVSDYYSFLYKSKVTFVYSISNFVHPLRKILGKKEYIFIESLGIMCLR